MNPRGPDSGAGLWSLAAYATMVLGAIALFLIVRRYGETLQSPARVASAAEIAVASDAAPNALFHVLLALAAVIVVGRLMARLFVTIGQPPVIGEVLAGIALGPSLLGRIAPDISSYILPVSAAPFLNLVAQLGIILYMFLVGLDLNADLLRGRARATVVTAGCVA